MKQCKKCKKFKPETSFFKCKIVKCGLRSKCKQCCTDYTRSYRSTITGKKKHKKSQKASWLRRRTKARQFIREYLSTHPCVDCKESRWQVLEFDHVRGKKLHNIATMVISGRTIIRLQKEIEKCEVRCANCHRLKTSVQFGWYQT